MKTNLAYFYFFICYFPVLSQEILIIKVGKKKKSVDKLKVVLTVAGDSVIKTF